MTGMIQGGWEYVWSAYGLSATVLVLYAVSMQLRLRKDPE
jgi:hypothetical protein